MKKLITGLMILMLCGMCRANNIGLVAHWKCNDASGQGVVLNSYSGNNGTHKTGAGNSNVTSIAGKINTAIDFTGDDTKSVNLGNISAIGTVKSIAFWMKLSNTTIVQGFIMFNVWNNNYIWRLGLNAVGMATVGDAVAYVDGVVSSTITTGRWMFIVITTATGASPIDFSLGAHVSSMLGAIDNVMLFDRVLTAREVRLLHNSGRGTEIVTEMDTSRRYGRRNRTRYTK